MTTTATAPASASTSEEPVLYSWLITLQYPAAGGFSIATINGTLPTRPGASRAGAYREIRAALTKQNPALERADVVFFSLEPDQL
jgi:hypothetical protein